MTEKSDGDVHTWLDEGDEPDEAPSPDDSLAEGEPDEPAPQPASLNQPRAGVQLAEPGRRFTGFVLEVVLFIGTFGIGWLIWSMLEWREGRTPAKRLLRDLVIVDAWSGQRVSWQRMALRELGAKIGLVGLFGLATLGLGWAIAGVLVLTETRAALWDRLAGTVVVHPGE